MWFLGLICCVRLWLSSTRSGVRNTTWMVSEPLYVLQKYDFFFFFLSSWLANKNKKEWMNVPNYWEIAQNYCSRQINYMFFRGVYLGVTIKKSRNDQNTKTRDKNNTFIQKFYDSVLQLQWMLRWCSLYFINKTKWMRTVVRNVCCQHVRRPCSIYLRAFPALRIVSRCNNLSIVYPKGDFV